MARTYLHDAGTGSHLVSNLIYSLVGAAVVGGGLFALAMFAMFAMVACPGGSCL